MWDEGSCEDFQNYGECSKKKSQNVLCHGFYTNLTHLNREMEYKTLPVRSACPPIYLNIHMYKEEREGE